MICRKYVCDANLSDLTILHKASMDVDRNPTVNSVKANYDTKKKRKETTMKYSMSILFC